MNMFAQLTNFIAIVENKSFTKAAEILHQSTPSTSRQLNELEQKLGQILILRTSKSLSLTEFGEMYYEEAKELMHQYQHLESMTHLYDKVPSGVLKIASPSCVIRKNILPHLKEFSHLYPQIVPDIEITDGTPEIHKRNIDITIMMDFLIERLESNQRDIIKRHLYDTKTVLCCSREYLANNKMIVSPKDLQKHSYITNSNRLQPQQIELENNLIIDAKPSLYVDSISAMIECAKNGIGIINVVNDYVSEEIESGNLIEILPDYSVSRKVYMYYRKIKYLEPKIGKFVDFYFEKIAKTTTDEK